MAQKIIHTLIDDMDGSEAAETVRFSLDGMDLEIDLNEANAEALRSILRPYVEKARRKSKLQVIKGGKTAHTPPTPIVRNRESSKVREWATSPEGQRILKARGLTVAPRGRISGRIEELYERRAELSQPEPEPAEESGGNTESPAAPKPARKRAARKAASA